MPSSSGEILVASNSQDRPHTGPVVELLLRQGFGVVEYDADKVASGEVQFGVNYDDTANQPLVTYDHQVLHPESVKAAWLRRPFNFGPKHQDEDRGMRFSIDRERTAAQSLVLNRVPEQRWLDSPNVIRSSGDKLTQLMVAKSVGLDIPATVVSNRWDEILQGIPEGEVIFKSFLAEFVQGNESKFLSTKLLHNDGKTPPVEGLPYPGIWQEYIPKGREWRLTIVGDDCYDAAIYTSKEARDDWRLHQADSSKVMFRHETFPDEYKRRCFEMKKQLDLRFGIWEFIETPAGELFFVEVNPNGQYLWLEQALGLPLSAAVASELGRIATET